MLEELVASPGNEASLEEKVLTTRQREILKVATTLDYKGDYRYHVGAVLGIAYNTVQNCTGEILKRFKVHDIFAAVLKTFQLRLLSVDEIVAEGLSELKSKLEELPPVEKKVLRAFYDCAMENGYANHDSVASKLNTT
ncbi:MAG: LuxR C-terminal-related transcriptional regulator, partial [Nanoarchaeota archaeon]